jgi:hypothetical protein
MPFAGVEANENDEDEAEHNNGEFDEAHNNDIKGADEDDAPIISDDEDSESGTDEADDTETAGVCPQGKVSFAGVPNNEEIAADNETIAADMDARYGHRSGRYILRRRKRPNWPSMCEDETQFFLKGDEIVLGPQDYSHLHTTLEHIVMTQHSVRKGLKLFGKDGENAIISEMQQFHDMDCIEPKQAQMLTREEKQAALNCLMFLKKERCGRIKGRGCADGRKQRLYKTKEETSTPTVAIESVFLTSVVDVLEDWQVVTLDIPGAFMKTDIDEVIHVQLEGPMARLLVKVNPRLYQKYLQEKDGKAAVMYVKLKRRRYIMVHYKQQCSSGKISPAHWRKWVSKWIHTIYMRCKQDNQWKAVYASVARERFEDLPHGGRGNRRYDWSTNQTMFKKMKYL